MGFLLLTILAQDPRLACQKGTRVAALHGAAAAVTADRPDNPNDDGGCDGGAGNVQKELHCALLLFHASSVFDKSIIA